MKGWLKRSVARRVAVLSAALAALFAGAVGLVVVRVVLAGEPELARRKVFLVAVLGGAATVVSVALATWAIVNRLLSRSLTDLTEIVRAAQRGKFLARARSGRADEIGELSRAIDTLGSQITDLSVAVIDGTRELEWTRSEPRLKEALALLFELSRAVTDPKLDGLDGVLDAIPRLVVPALDLEEMEILLHDETSGSLVVRASHRGKPMVEGSFLSVPLELHGRLIGRFHVVRSRPGAPSEGDLRLLTLIANHCALAIAHAQAHARAIAAPGDARASAG